MNLYELNDSLSFELNEAESTIQDAVRKFIKNLGGLQKVKALYQKWVSKPENKKIMDMIKQKYNAKNEDKFLNEALMDIFKKNKRKVFVALLFAISMGIVTPSAVAEEPIGQQAMGQAIEQNREALQDAAQNAKEWVGGLLGRLGDRVRGGDTGPEPEPTTDDYDDLPDGPLANKRVSTSGLTQRDILDAYKEAYGGSGGANRYNQLNNLVSSSVKASDVATQQMQQRAWLQKALAKLPSQVVQNLQADGDITIRS